MLLTERRKLPAGHRKAICALPSLSGTGKVWAIPRSSPHWGCDEEEHSDDALHFGLLSVLPA